MKSGLNYLPLPKDREDSRIVPALAPLDDEIVLARTIDSALPGTDLRLMLHNMGIKDVIVAGIFTDQCISSSVRSLTDESHGVVQLHEVLSSSR